jgi:hypothetical protein
MYVEALVDALKLGAAAVNSPVTVAAGKSCSGEATILQILETGSDGQKEVRTSLPRCKEVRADGQGRVRFEGESHKVVTVVESAVVRAGGRPSVFLVEDGFARQHRITVGEGRDGRLEAIAGLAPGSKVVVNPPAGLKDGALVVVQK